MSEYATFLKVGATSILLRMLEDPGVVLRDMTLENPIRAIREISHDTTCRRRVRLANGREASAARHPGRVPQPGQALPGDPGPLAPRGPGPACGSTASRGWRPTRWSLDRECDWVIKHRLIERYRERGRGAAHPPESGADRPAVPRCEPGAGPVLQDAGPRAWSSGPAPTRRSTPRWTQPPQTTRAKLRGEFIRRAKERRRDFTVDWVHLKLNDQAQRTVLCKDPFKSRDERVEKLIASL